MQHLNIVISGFAPYDGVDVNPAVEVPKALAERGLLGDDVDFDDPLRSVDLSINVVTLPISFANAWPTLHQAVEQYHPDIVIATGLKRAARGILLERCATNVMDAAKPDADNALPRREPIDINGPAAYWTRLPLRSILRDFAAHGVPATLSSDAGTFVCNSLFYSLLNWASVQSHVLAGFVSFPCINEASPAQSYAQSRTQHGLPLEQQIIAGRDVVRETVRYYIQPSSGDILLG